MFAKITLTSLLAIILGIPFIMSVANREPPPPPGATTLLVVTPHVPQIRREFTEAFERWHEREFNERVRVDMRTPGGTSEILTQLDAQIASEIKSGRIEITPDGRITLADGSAAYDLMFGGGSFDHGRLKSGVRIAQPLLSPSPMLKSLGLDGLKRDEIEIARTIKIALGDIARLRLSRGSVFMKWILDARAAMDPNTTALDTAAIRRVFWRPIPQGIRIFESDTATPMVEVTVAMSQPAGFEPAELETLFGHNSIGAQTLYDPDQYWIGTALSSFGIVYNRDLCEELGVGIPDSFDSLTDPRLIGEVALADPRQSGSITTTFDSILGNEGWDEGWRILRAMSANTRYFTNSSTKPPMDVSQGEAATGLAIDFYGRGQAQAVGGDRVGYAEPAGAVYIDADPVSVLNGAPNEELARRFVRFVLSDEGQALWNFHSVNTDAGATNPKGPAGERMGPTRYELRRMPVRRAMFARYESAMIDRVNPFDIASDTQNPGWRTGVQVMMGAFAIDAGAELRAAWAAIDRARRTPGFPPETITRMEAMFFEFPTQRVADGTVLPFNEENYRAIRNVWRDPIEARRSEIAYVRFFREQFARIVDLSHNPSR